MYAACQIISEMSNQGNSGSVVSLICDSGDPYLDTYYNNDWLKQNNFDIAPYLQKLEEFYDKGAWIVD